jgi:tetratricopeptide (TPR) repeat protein
MMQQRGLGLGATLLLALLGTTGCQNLTPVTEHRSVSIDTPFFPQEDYQCGPAALAMVLTLSGHPTTPDSLIHEVWLPDRRGALTVELQAAARSRGVLVYPITDSEALLAELDAGRPLVVLQNLGSARWPRWHFAVVTGYTDNGRHMLLHSDTRPFLRMGWNRFIRTWGRADFSAFVLLPDNTLPAHSNANTLAQALDALAHSHGQTPLGYWQLAARRHHDSAIVHLGLGNAYYHSEQKTLAVRSYQRAIQRDARMAGAWNNLAHTLNQLGCSNAARKAIDQALELSPGHPVYQQTSAGIRDDDHCQLNQQVLP